MRTSTFPSVGWGAARCVRRSPLYPEGLSLDRPHDDLSVKLQTYHYRRIWTDRKLCQSGLDQKWVRAVAGGYAPPFHRLTKLQLSHYIECDVQVSTIRGSHVKFAKVSSTGLSVSPVPRRRDLRQSGR